MDVAKEAITKVKTVTKRQTLVLHVVYTAARAVLDRQPSNGSVGIGKNKVLAIDVEMCQKQI